MENQDTKRPMSARLTLAIESIAIRFCIACQIEEENSVNGIKQMFWDMASAITSGGAIEIQDCPEQLKRMMNIYSASPCESLIPDENGHVLRKGDPVAFCPICNGLYNVDGGRNCKIKQDEEKARSENGKSRCEQ